MIAGIQKCGTTSLWRFLRKHPQIKLANKKELHFFNKPLLFKTSKELDFRDYHHQFWSVEDNHFDKDFLYGEATPCYSKLNTKMEMHALKLIKQYNPNIKIILLFRDPAERAYSHWNMLRRNGKMPLSFDEVIHLYKAGNLKDQWHQIFLRGKYGTIVEKILKLFPADNCLFLEPGNVQNSIPIVEDFLAIDHHQYQSLQTKKADYPGSMSQPAKEFLQEFYQQESELLFQLTGIDINK